MLQAAAASSARGARWPAGRAVALRRQAAAGDPSAARAAAALGAIGG